MESNRRLCCSEAVVGKKEKKKPTVSGGAARFPGVSIRSVSAFLLVRIPLFSFFFTESSGGPFQLPSTAPCESTVGDVCPFVSFRALEEGQGSKRGGEKGWLVSGKQACTRFAGRGLIILAALRCTTMACEGTRRHGHGRGRGRVPQFLLRGKQERGLCVRSPALLVQYGVHTERQSGR